MVDKKTVNEKTKEKNMNAKLNTITVAELIETLKGLPEDALVAFASDYGDRCHTMQVHKLNGEAEMMLIEESAYSNSGFAIDSEGNDQENRGDGDIYDQQRVYILS